MTNAIWIKRTGGEKSNAVARRARWRRWRRSRAATQSDGAVMRERSRRLRADTARVGRTGHRFDAKLDLMEFDDRERPNRIFSGVAVEIGPGHLLLRTRRMCHAGRELLIAVHLVDSAPAPLAGVVTSCEYERDGMHVVELSLRPLPDDDQLLNEWVDRCEVRGSF
jgi:hypothetical protein